MSQWSVITVVVAEVVGGQAAGLVDPVVARLLVAGHLWVPGHGYALFAGLRGRRVL